MFEEFERFAEGSPLARAAGHGTRGGHDAATVAGLGAALEARRTSVPVELQTIVADGDPGPPPAPASKSLPSAPGVLAEVSKAALVARVTGAEWSTSTVARTVVDAGAGEVVAKRLADWLDATGHPVPKVVSRAGENPDDATVRQLVALNDACEAAGLGVGA